MKHSQYKCEYNDNIIQAKEIKNYADLKCQNLKET